MDLTFIHEGLEGLAVRNSSIGVCVYICVLICSIL